MTALATQPLWLRAIVQREGDDVVTRCCVVTEGQFFPIEVRVNVPRLAAALRASGLVPQGEDSVSGFGSFLKKAVKAVTKNKVTRAVGKVVKKVARSPVAMIANPALAISAHTVSKAATGKGTIKGPLGKVVDLGASAALTAAGPAAKLPAVGSGALQFVSPRASTALGVGLNAVLKAQAGGAIAAAAKATQSQLSGLGPAAAAQLKAKITAAGPALAKRAVESAKVKAQFVTIAQKAKAGSPDALLAARVIGRSAQAVAEVNRLQQSFGGGVPGLLITAQGRIVRAPKGKFLQRSQAAAHPDVLYRGRATATLKGAFTAVSGAPSYAHAWPSVGSSPAWGGDRDPGNDIDGPLQDVDHPGGDWKLDDYSQVAGALTP